jgi:ppGpp synthetase/RelA/SpoT-type nucleotidyltranferase
MSEENCSEAGFSVPNWLNDQVSQYKPLKPRYEALGKFIADVLATAVKPICPSALISERVKGVESFARKILGWREELDRDGKEVPNFATDLHDLSGIRAVVHLQEEIQLLCEFVKSHFETLEISGEQLGARNGVREFGYESTHIIVQLRDGVYQTRSGEVKPDPNLVGMKAEIQIRTIAQHAWADTVHDRLYKSAFTIPASFNRESARVAAMLENADQSFAQMANGIDELSRNVSVHMNHDVARQEIARQEAVLPFAENSSKIVARVARLHLALGDFEETITNLEDYAKTNDGHLDSEMSCLLGSGYCRQNRYNRQNPDYAKGLAYLKTAVEQDPMNLEALTTLAEGVSDEYPSQALAYFKQAFEIAPTDPQSLAGFLRHEIAEKGDLSIVSLVRANIFAAIEKCKLQAEVGVNLPIAYYNTAEFELFVGDEYRAMSALTKAITYSSDAHMIERALAAIRLLKTVEEKAPCIGWARRLLVAASHAKFPDSKTLADVCELSTGGLFERPLVIVAGGCDPFYEEHVKEYEAKLQTAFSGFRGTIVSGGTEQGISGMVGRLKQSMGEALVTVGYVPRTPPDDGTAIVDDVNFEIRYSSGDGKFTALEPLQSWIDMLASGIKPEEVKLLGINGGQITGFEYRVASAFGARVGVIRHSGREADRFEDQSEWSRVRGLFLLPDDAQTLRVFVQGAVEEFPNPTLVDEIAEGFQEGYQETVRVLEKPKDAAQRDWSDLEEEFRDSNRQQVQHIIFKLGELNLTAVQVEGRPPRIREFEKDELETLSELEHARYNVERVLKGWQSGERDPAKRKSPHLKPWSGIDDKVRDYDRRSVRLIPKLLAKAGFEIRPKGLIDLVDQPDKYFEIPKDAELLPIKMLTPTRARIGGIYRANGFMQQAFEGKTDRRQPLEVCRNDDGTYDIQDGNSTFANAEFSGWQDLPCLVVERKKP